MDNTIKSINFADDTEGDQRTERISPELVNGYRAEYASELLAVFWYMQYAIVETLTENM